LALSVLWGSLAYTLVGGTIGGTLLTLAFGEATAVAG
jgi:hypothetical protein